MGVALETHMYTETFPTTGTSPSIVPVRVVTTAAFALVGARTPLHVEIKVGGEEAARPDPRSASEHLANIRNVLNPAIADLAGTFCVSRQTIYKWLKGESTPKAQ